MEVVKQNFKETLPQISASIKKADFLVIDAEFTGLMNGRDVSIFDLPRDYYKCLLNGSTEFLIIQFGLCAFYWDEENKHYMNDAYNFYLFPRGKPGPEKIFMCQSSSLDFLIAQGFDFNKMIRDGISYMTELAETKLREQLKERQKSVKEKDIIPIPEEHRNIIEETCKKVRRFLDDDDKADDMLIDRCNAFQRLLLYQELKIRFKEEIMLETHIQENKNRVLKVIRMKSQNDEKKHTNQKKEREWEDLEENVGFSKVARMISQSEKLVIGHNMLLDVLHTLNNFFHPLPDDYYSFKEFAHCMFPNLLDTKYMSSLPPFKDKVNSSVLHHLLATLSEPPFSLPKVGSYEGRGYKKADEKHHEAGFDAYITGLCFLSMHSHLSRMRGEENARASPASPVLKPFLNKLFLAKTAHQDSPYMNLTGADPTPSREHVFHLTFPKEWTRNDINLLFSPYGPIVCQFLDETRAIVALTRRENARVVTRGIASNLRVKLVPYDFYKAKMTPRDRYITLGALLEEEAASEEDNIILERIKLLAQEHLPDGWTSWRVVRLSLEEVVGEVIDPRLFNQLCFALPPLELLRAFDPGADRVSEEGFNYIKRKLLECEFTRALITGPQEWANKVRGSPAQTKMFNQAVANYGARPRLIPQKEAARARPTSRESDLVPRQSRKRPGSGSSSEAYRHGKRSKVELLEERMCDMFDALVKRIDSFNRCTHAVDIQPSEWSSEAESDNESEYPHSASSSVAASSFWKPPTLGFSDSVPVAGPGPLSISSRKCQKLNMDLELTPKKELACANFEFRPSVKEAEPAVMEPDPVIKQEGVECHRFGSQSWNRIRYKEVEKHLLASPVFSALKVNTELGSLVPSTMESIKKQDSTLGALVHGILIERKALAQHLKTVASKFPEATQELARILADGSAFRTASDNLLQFACGHRAEIIETRRKVFRPKNKVLKAALHQIPPSETHLFEEKALSGFIKDNGGISAVFPSRSGRFPERKVRFNSSTFRKPAS